MNVYVAMVIWYLLGEIELLGMKYYVVSVVGIRMDMELWWNGTDRETELLR